MNGDGPGAKRSHSFFVIVDDDHIMSDIRKTCSGDQSHIS